MPPPTLEPVSPPNTGIVGIIHTQVVSSIRIDEYLKGSGPRLLDVESLASVFQHANGDVTIEPGTSPSCGFAPPLGETWILFVTRNPSGSLQTGGCSGNIPAAEGDPYALSFIEQIKQILQAPTPTASSPAPTGTVAALPIAGSGERGSSELSLWPGVAAACAGALLAATALFGLRDRGASK
ncbi:MAG: hypothetical protein WBD55_05905 [Dehalococcoidia bacterium]